MDVHVRLFAGLRQRAGTDIITLQLPDGASVADALERLGSLIGDVPVVMAVNREYAPAETLLRPEDELALIPPVSGGATDPAAPAHARIVAGPLSLDALIERVRDPRAGAVVTFSGITRDVPALEYEAYAEMAQEKLAQIVSTAITQHGLLAAAAEHRIGTVPLMEASVIVAASAVHRAEAFAGARSIIDSLKATAPIWKQEEGEWVGGAVPEGPSS